MKGCYAMNRSRFQSRWMFRCWCMRWATSWFGGFAARNGFLEHVVNRTLISCGLKNGFLPSQTLEKFVPICYSGRSKSYHKTKGRPLSFKDNRKFTKDCNNRSKFELKLHPDNHPSPILWVIWLDQHWRFVSGIGEPLVRRKNKMRKALCRAY
jgi:hypothetical protein